MAFRYIIAHTEEEKQQCFALRYQIYVEEFGFEPPNSQRIETDEYDQNAVHILAYEAGTNNVAGTARLVLPSPKGLPVQSFPSKLEYPENYKKPSDNAIVEMSRVAVAKAYRRATQNRAAFGENASPPGSPPASPRSNSTNTQEGQRPRPQQQDAPTPSSPPTTPRQSISPLSPRRAAPPTPPTRPFKLQLQQQEQQQPAKVESPPSSPRGTGQGPELMLGLLCKSFLAAQSLDYDYVLFVTEAKIVHSCTHYGLGAAFVQIGEMVEYHGVRRAPYIAKLSEALDKAEELNPAVHSYILREKREAEMGRPLHAAMTAPTPSLRRHLLTRQKSVSQMAAFFDAPIGSY